MNDDRPRFAVLRELPARARSYPGVLALALRLRIRATSARARVTLHVRGHVARIRRGVRVRIGRRARAGLFIGDAAQIERGGLVVLGTGTVTIEDGAVVGPGCVLEVSDGGALVISVAARLGAGCVIRAVGRVVEISPDAVVGDYCIVGSGEGVDDILVGPGAELGPRTVLRPGARVAPGGTTAAHATVPATQGPASRDAPAETVAIPAPGDATLNVSVVVPTLNRAAAIPRLVGALAAQTLAPARFELVVVDDGSTDGTAEVLGRLAETAPFPVRVIRRERAAGPAAARNAGWRAASAPLVAFTDDDCDPSSEWLAEGAARFAGDGGPGLVQGRTLPDPVGQAGGGAFVITNRVTRGGRHYETCNVFYRKDVLERVGGFDERFPYPMAEDTDLAWRAIEGGAEAAFEPAAIVHHDVRDVGLRGLVRRGRNLASHALLVRTHRRARRLYHLGLFLRRSHLRLLLAVGSFAAAALVTPWFWLGGVPYVTLHLFDRELPRSLAVRLAALPGLAVVDVVEIASLARASVRWRRLLL